MFKQLGFIAALASALTVGSPPQSAKADPMIGQVILFAGDFCPRGYAEANGALLPIGPNTALYSILGTNYGGDGRTTFALPNLQRRAPVHRGQIPGASSLRVGSTAGSTEVTLTEANMPRHAHDTEVDLMSTTNQTNRSRNPAGLMLAPSPGAAVYGHEVAPLVEMSPDALTVKDHERGGSQPFSIQSPILAMMYCVAITGTYPSR